jgi:hypothetical protein
MNIREWVKRTLSFICGAVVAGLLIVNTTSYGEPSSNLEQRVTALEQRVAELAKAVANKQDAPRPCHGRNCD